MLIDVLKKYHILFILSLTYIPLFKYFVRINNEGGHPFLTGDWLISYKYGFVSKGLIGNLFIHLLNKPDLLLDLISGLVIVIYLFIFYFLNQIFLNYKQNFLSYVIIFSPATFLFPILDSQGAFRKEIIGILSLVMLAAYIKSNNLNFLLLSSIIYTVGIFSHAVNLFFLSSILILIYAKRKKHKIIEYFSFLFPTVIFFISFLFYSPSEQKVNEIIEKICFDLEKIELDNLCSFGSIEVLSWDLNAAYLITQNYIINENREKYLIYFLLFFISILPLFFDKNLTTQFLSYLIICFSFIPLFLIGFDWGRWIYITSICLSIVYLISDKKIGLNNFRFLFLLYPFLFRIEHCCNPELNISFQSVVNNISYLLSNFLNIFIL